MSNKVKPGLQNSDSPEPFSWRIVPDGDSKCIWMNAGIIEYKLCDRDFDCENCPLDEDLRLPPPITKTHADSVKDEIVYTDVPNIHEIHVQRMLQNYQTFYIRKDVKYTLSHLWLRAISSHEFIIGIDDFFARILPKQFSIVLTTDSTNVLKGDAIGWIQIHDLIIQIPSPCTGVVQKTNRQIIENRHLLYDSPYDKGWLAIFDVKQNATEWQKCISFDAMKTKFQTDTSKLLNRFSNVLLRHSTIAGQTMNDGGIPVRTIEEVFGLHEYVKIIKSVLK